MTDISTEGKDIPSPEIEQIDTITTNTKETPKLDDAKRPKFPA